MNDINVGGPKTLVASGLGDKRVGTGAPLAPITIVEDWRAGNPLECAYPGKVSQPVLNFAKDLVGHDPADMIGNAAKAIL
jgi:hypothetical protein